jgi:hypothetical protein
MLSIYQYGGFMRTIQIDDDVYNYIGTKAKPFEETTPNMTLRRLFGLSISHRQEVSVPVVTSMGVQQTDGRVSARLRQRKSQKTDLYALLSTGALREGQTLYLYDYQKKRARGYEAKLSGRFLMYEGKHYSMSELAKQLLKNLGYQSNSVRGPMFWGTADGCTIKELWEKYLAGKNGSRT